MKQTVRRNLNRNFAVLGFALLSQTSAYAGVAPFLAPIIGGTDVQANDPIAEISVAIYNNAEGGLCTGSIIANDLVVTAHHCLGTKASDLFVILNRDVNQLAQTDVVQVIGQVGHPLYDPNSMEKDAHDIALIRIKGTFPAGYHSAKRLPLTSKFTKGQEVILAGYGISKSTANDPSGATAGVLRKTGGVLVDDPTFALTEILLDQTQGHGACHGDSGGPAYVKAANGDLLLWGVTNRGYPDDGPDDCAHGSIYTNINTYDQWLTESATTLHKL